MWIERIALRRFLCFDDIEVRFERGLTIVHAPNEGGKSSLMQGITTALYHKASSTAEKVRRLKRWGSGRSFSVEMDLHLEKERYRIVRDFEAREQFIYRGDETDHLAKGSSVDTFLREQLLLPEEDLFLRVVGVRQEELARVSGGAGAIGEQLEEILGGGWGDATPDKVERAVRKAAGELSLGKDRPAKRNGPIKSLSDEIEQLQKDLGEAERAASRRGKILGELSDAHGERAELEHRYARLEEKLKRAQEHRRAKKVEASLGKRAMSIRKQKERLEELLGERESHRRELDRLPHMLRGLEREGIENRRVELDREVNVSKLVDIPRDQTGRTGATWQVAAGSVFIIAGIVTAFLFSPWFLSITASGLILLTAGIVGLKHSYALRPDDRFVSELDGLRRARCSWAGDMSLEDARALLEEAAILWTGLERTEIQLGELVPEGMVPAEFLGRLDTEYNDIALEHAAVKSELGKLDDFDLGADAVLELERDIDHAGQRIEERGEQISRMERELASVRMGNVVELRERLASCKEALEREEHRFNVLGVIGEVLEEARAGMKGHLAEQLPPLAGRYLSSITSGRYHSLFVDPVTLAVEVTPAEDDVPAEGGEVPGRVEPALLSQGARDQIYFALRVAIVDLMSRSERLPLFLDDPFVHFDPVRRARAVEVISGLAGDHQVVLFTCDPQYREVGGKLVALPPSASPGTS